MADAEIFGDEEPHGDVGLTCMRARCRGALRPGVWLATGLVIAVIAAVALWYGTKLQSERVYLCTECVVLDVTRPNETNAEVVVSVRTSEGLAGSYNATCLLSDCSDKNVSAIKSPYQCACALGCDDFSESSECDFLQKDADWYVLSFALAFCLLSLCALATFATLYNRPRDYDNPPESGTRAPETEITEISN